MNAVCLLDTPIFVEILNVPGKAQHHPQTLQQLKERIQAGQSLFLPMATIFETGNIWSFDEHLQAYDRAPEL